jgi:hypothetical protein
MPGAPLLVGVIASPQKKRVVTSFGRRPMLTYDNIVCSNLVTDRVDISGGRLN